MKILLSILGSLTIIGSGTATFTSATHHLKTTTNNSTNEDKEPIDSNSQEGQQSDISKFLEEYLSAHPDSQLETDLLSSLVLTDQGIQINLNLLEVYQADNELYSILSSIEFINNLNEMYNQQYLTYNVDYKVFSFDDEFQAESNNPWIWKERHWYWFGFYFRLHFSHDFSQEILRILNITGDIAGILFDVFSEYPVVGEILVALSVFCVVNGWIFSHYDQGKGVWIGILICVPDMGWGSNK